MKPPSKRMLRRLAAAVELFSFGCGWEFIARQLRMRPEVCRRWPLRYPEVWYRLFDEAEKRRDAEAHREAVIVLKHLLYSPDPTVRARAVRALLPYRTRKRLIAGVEGAQGSAG